ncbi:putative Cis-zeatin O-glucosyltransferase 2 [Hypsibius exemplaris]|uniref:Cis-zeatin O-glucosyltransferase 2 n=1 Tax=Hypsibius exemplaris TaxID=2072580 RepID=A0A9X6NJ65_HYPEX|nr:putative Cis-zeatin O-glucosyltransferase 2 [Hypsibius exemplaris]
MSLKVRKHILLLPFPAYGHVIPLLELGRKIYRHHDVTFAVAIPDGFAGFDGLDRQSWLDSQTLVFPAIADLLRAIPINQQPSTRPGDGRALSITRAVDVVIGDNCAPSPMEICHDRGVPFFYFNTGAATMTLGSLFVDEDYPILPDSEDDIFAFMEVPLPGAPLPPMSKIYKEIMMEMSRITSLVSGIIFNSVRELEEDVVRTIETFPAMKGIPLLFVGPLMPQTEKINVGQLEQQEKVEKWLDRREKLSVTYVSFGSIAVPNGEQIAEVAEALLATGKPFIWSLPKAEQRHLPAEVIANISRQFEGGSLESLAAGLPVLAWPMFADQKINAEWLVQRSTALMVEGTGLKPKRVVPAEEIAILLKRIGGEQTTDTIFRAAAQEWKFILDAALAVGGSSQKAFRSIIEFADNTRS